MKKIKIGAFGVFSLEYTGKKLKLYIDYKYFFFTFYNRDKNVPGTKKFQPFFKFEV